VITPIAYNKMKRLQVLLLNNYEILLLLSITLFGAILRLYNLGYKSLWLDEAVIFQISQGSIHETLLENSQHNSAPPLFPLLINITSRIGDSEALLRLIPAMAGIIAVPMFYLMNKEVMSRNAAFVTTLLVSTSTTQVRYSQQLREYSLTFCFAILALLSLCYFLRSHSWGSWFVVVSTFTLCIFTYYGLAILIAALNVVFLISILPSHDKLNMISKWILAQLIVLMAVVIVYNVSLKAQYQPEGFAAASYLGKAYWQGETLRSFLAFGIDNTRDLIDFAYHSVELFPLLVGIGLIISLAKDRRSLAFLLIVIPISITFALASRRMFPYHGGRHDIFLTPMIYMASGLGIDYLLMVDRKRIIVCLIILILGVSGLFARPTGVTWYLRSTTPEHSRPVINVLKNLYQPGDEIFSNYFAGYALRYYLRDTQDINISSLNYLHSTADVSIREINKLVSQPGRYWIFFSHCDGECTAVLEYIGELEAADEMSVNNGVWLYLVNNN